MEFVWPDLTKSTHCMPWRLSKSMRAKLDEIEPDRDSLRRLYDALPTLTGDAAERAKRTIRHLEHKILAAEAEI